MLSATMQPWSISDHSITMQTDRIITVIYNLYIVIIHFTNSIVIFIIYTIFIYIYNS